MDMSRTFAQNVVLLADEVSARAVIVGTLLEEIETSPFKVIRCAYVAECLEHLNALLVRPCLLVAHYHLADGPLVPALQRWHASQQRPLPQLILWGPDGLLDVMRHESFLREQRAVVFSFPLDLDAILGVACALAQPRWFNISSARRLAHCGWLCRRRRVCIDESWHCQAGG
jgi:hypothetical protein